MELNKSYIKNLELIGSGCFGKVYKDRNVVYKLYRESFDNYDKFQSTLISMGIEDVTKTKQAAYERYENNLEKAAK